MLDKELLMKCAELQKFEKYLSDRELKGIVGRMVVAHYRNIKGTTRPFLSEVTEKVIKELFDRDIEVNTRMIERLESKMG